MSPNEIKETSFFGFLEHRERIFIRMSVLPRLQRISKTLVVMWLLLFPFSTNCWYISNTSILISLFGVPFASVGSLVMVTCFIFISLDR